MAQDARLRERLAVRLRGALGLGVAAAAVSLLLTVGVRPDVGQALQDWRFLVKFMITTALAVSAGRLVFALGGPLPVSSSGLAGLAAGPAILATAVAAELASQPAAAWAGLAIGRNSLVCLTVIPLLSAVPLAFLLAVLRSGAPRRPGLAGAMAGLAAAGIAATFYAANCTDDSPLFVLLWYPVATAMVALAGAICGRRLLRW